MNFGHGSAKSAEVLVSILSSAHDTQVLVFFRMLQTTSASLPIKRATDQNMICIVAPKMAATILDFC